MKHQPKTLHGANMDIDLTSAQNVTWKQDLCPWNEAENSGTTHKCAIKNTSICDYFCGVQAPDNVLCSYPHQNED
ncbi:hypothetical protein M1116_02725 [Patescibacteria group bacterium]|nr:hypothetical protein [Patescibacteria group bacterium]